MVARGTNPRLTTEASAVLRWTWRDGHASWHRAKVRIRYQFHTLVGVAARSYRPGRMEAFQTPLCASPRTLLPRMQARVRPACSAWPGRRRLLAVCGGWILHIPRRPHGRDRGARQQGAAVCAGHARVRVCHSAGGVTKQAAAGGRGARREGAACARACACALKLEHTSAASGKLGCGPKASRCAWRRAWRQLMLRGPSCTVGVSLPCMKGGNTLAHGVLRGSGARSMGGPGTCMQLHAFSMWL